MLAKPAQRDAIFNKRTLFVHIGHPKTGSSYIQVLLAANEASLRRNGLRFPDDPATLRARQADPSRGGNGGAWVLKKKDFLENVTSGTDSVVLSAERLFFPFSEGENLLADYTPAFARTKVLLFIRDPLDFVRSWYMQREKRGDFIDTFDDFVVENDFFADHLGRIEGVINFCAQNGFELAVRNYSRLEAPLDDVIEDLLELPNQALQRLPVKKVNRGLTRSEFYLQQRLNSELGENFDIFLGGRKMKSRDAAYQLVSKAFCVGLPDLEADQPGLSAGVHEEFCQRMNAGIARLNPLLPEGARLDLLEASRGAAPVAPTPENPLVFSQAQVDVLARSMAEVLRGCARPEGFWPRLRAALARTR